MHPGSKITPCFTASHLSGNVVKLVYQEDIMGFIGFVMSVVGLVFMAIALIPFLGWINWFVIPFTITGLIVSYMGIVRGGGRLLGIIGVILCIVVIAISTVRLIIGLGII
jgi:ABC-type multidrug transport system permease subunit